MPRLSDFLARDRQGREVPLSTHAGKVVLVVNTASQCGFTPQYEGLQALYRRHGGAGLVILGFPCNQFGRQEPGDPGPCLINHGVDFPVYEKVEVNGPQAHPLFAWLTAALPGFLGAPIRWNFTKFLLDREGCPIRRFAPVTKPARLERFIVEALRR